MVNESGINPVQKMCASPAFLVFLSASVASHADSNVFQQKAEKTKNGIVADVNARQKMFSNRLKDTTSDR